MRAVSRRLLLLAARRLPSPSPRLRVDHAWVRLAAVPGRPAAAYLTVHGGKEPNRLIAIDSRQAGSSELHESMKSGQDMASMRRLDGVDLPADGTVIFAPGGYHVMLFGVGPQVKPGDTMPLVARFAKGEPIAVEAKVVGVARSGALLICPMRKDTVRSERSRRTCCRRSVRGRCRDYAQHEREICAS